MATEKSLAQEIKEREDMLKKLELDVTRLSQDYALKKDELVKAEEIINQLKQEREALIQEKNALMEQLNQANQSLDSIRKKLALVPVEMDAGVTPQKINDGQTGEPVDHKKILASLTGAEKIKYYRAHKHEIDSE